jgi:hypothetical protein
MAIDAPYNVKSIYLSYLYFNKLRVKLYRPTYQAAAEATTTSAGSTYYNILGTCAHKDGYCDYLLLAPTGTGANKVVHIRYIEQGYAFTAEHIVDVFSSDNDAVDLSISHDAWGNLVAFWSKFSDIGNDIDVYYSISFDDGETWDAATLIPKTLGHGPYTDSVTGSLSARSTVIGGIDGHMFGYTRSIEGVPKTFIRYLGTTDGITYTLEDEYQVGRVAKEEDSVPGLRWFQPPAAALLDLSDPVQIRIAYQIGEGNSTVGNDTIPIRICQEKLGNSAFHGDEIGEYITDQSDDHTLLVTVDVLGGPIENSDYYGQGLTGSITERYMSAFRKVGLSVELHQYEPDPYAQMDDRSAYDEPLDFVSLVVIEPGSYEAPLSNRGNEGYTTYIERDIRKIYLPPDRHLERNLIINDGNFLKRTVWTTFFDGNEYEISQVVPYFIKQQIAYYSANMYVIGPSNDPFSRRVLPSET